MRTLLLAALMSLIAFYSPSKASYDGGTLTASKWAPTVNPAKGRPHRIITNQTKIQVGTGPFNVMQQSSPRRQHVLEWGTNAMPVGSFSLASSGAGTQGTFTDFLGLEAFLDKVASWSGTKFDFEMWDASVRNVKYIDDVFEFVEMPRDNYYRGSITLEDATVVIATFTAPFGWQNGFIGNGTLMQILAGTGTPCVPDPLGTAEGYRVLSSRPLYESSIPPGALVGKKLILKKNPDQDGFGAYDGESIPFGTPLDIIKDETQAPVFPGCTNSTRRITWSTSQPEWGSASPVKVDIEIVE